MQALEVATKHKDVVVVWARPELKVYILVGKDTWPALSSLYNQQMLGSFEFFVLSAIATLIGNLVEVITSASSMVSNNFELSL